MTVRSLNGLNGSTTNVVITNYMDAALPLEQTQANTLSPIVLSIKGLSTMGADGQIMKVNSSGELYWSADTDTTYTGTAPIVISGTTISYDNTTSGTFTNKTFGDLTMFQSSLSCRNSSSSGYIRLYTNGALSTNFVDLFTPNNLTQDHTIFLPSANGILALTTDIIQPNYGGTGKNNLSNETGKVLRVNSNGNGYDFYTLPSPITQYWGLSGNVLSPTSSYDLQVAEIINIGSSTVYYQLKTDTTNDAFQLTEADGTTVLKYTSNGRLDFGYSTLIGSNPAYPAGQGLPFGTTGTIYSSSIYSNIITTDDITLSEYGASPPTTDSYIRCNSSGNLTFSAGGEFATDLKVGDFMKFEKDGAYGYIFDPRQNSGTPTSVYNLISYHNNGTETAINNWSASSGLSSHFSINFGGAMKFRFHTDETLKVGSKSFLFPILGGTLARLADIPGNSYINSVSSPAFTVDGNGLLSLGNVGVAEGGTGLTSAAFGSLLYGKPPDMGLISIGSNNDYLKVVNGIPGWVSEPNNGQWSVSSTVISPTNATVTKLDIGSGTAFFRVEKNTYGTGSHTLKNPNSSAPTGQEWFLYWRDDANITMINAGATSGSVHLGVANAVKLNASYDKIYTYVPLEAFGDFTQVSMNATPTVIPSFTTPRFKIATGTSPSQLETWISNPGGDAASAANPIIRYHNNGSYVGLLTPAGGTTDGYSIQLSVGTALKLKIGGATTVSYNPMIFESGLISNSINNRIGFQESLPGYGTNQYGVIVAEQTYGYFASATIPGSGTGGSYDGYWGQGAVGSASDRRLKTNINTIENPIDIIKRLRGVNFEWKCEGKPKGVQIGYIAQEVKEVIPSIVDFLPTKCEMCPEGTYGVAPMNISAVLVEGIKAQQIAIDTLKTELDTVKTELDTYKSIINKLTNSTSFKSFKESLI